jgi:hypothetical protein
MSTVSKLSDHNLASQAPLFGLSKKDLLFVRKLSKRTYSNNKLLSNASESEKQQLKEIKEKMKKLAKYFAEKNNALYGPFQSDVVTGNDIAIGGTKLKGIWSVFYKGAGNKQFAAQITFGINTDLVCLNVSFSFGDAEVRSIKGAEKEKYANQSKMLRQSLANSLNNNEEFRRTYFELFDFGFSAYTKEGYVTGNNWINGIMANEKGCGITAKIFPNDFDVIEYSKIDSYISQLIFLMGGISNNEASVLPKIAPRTPEQRAREAERLAEIGMKGELYIMRREKEKLESLGLNYVGYPDHVALKSTTYGYDIISLDDKNNKIFIEVKTTTKKKEDENAKIFFLSSNEYNVYTKNKLQYKLYRVYDIENCPSYEIINLETVVKEPDGYICKY